MLGFKEMKLKTKDLLTLAELTPKEFVDLIDSFNKTKKRIQKRWKQTYFEK